MNTTTFPSNSDFVLDNPYHYHTWFAKIQGSVPKDLWKYFDIERNDEFHQPEAVTIDQIRNGAENLHQLSATEKTIFSQLRTVYTQELTQYQRLLTEEAKLRERIMNSISDAKKPQLMAEESTREWLRHLSESTRPSDSQMQELIRAKHRQKMTVKYSDWPIGGPQKWISEWQRVMGECRIWCPSLYEIWISDFNLMWGEVPGAKFLCSQMRMDQKRGHTEEWSIYRAAQELQDAWDEKSVRSGMRTSGRAQIFKAAFTVEPRFDGEAMEEMEGLEQTTTGTPGPLKRGKDSNKRRRTAPWKESSNKRRPCWICDGSHRVQTCFLGLGNVPKGVKIPEENKKNFREEDEEPIICRKDSKNQRP